MSGAPDEVRDLFATLLDEHKTHGAGLTALARHAAWLHWYIPQLPEARRPYAVLVLDRVVRTLRGQGDTPPPRRRPKARSRALAADLL